MTRTYTPPPKLRDREPPPAPTVRPIARGVYAPVGVSAAQSKSEKRSDHTIEAKAHKDALAALGCMVCRRLHGPHAPGPVELHHLRAGGWGKGDYLTLMPLCRAHHVGPLGVHGLGTKGFYTHYGFDQHELLADALEMVGKA